MVNDVRRGVDPAEMDRMTFRAVEPKPFTANELTSQQCACGRAFSRAQDVYSCPCGVSWVSRRAMTASANLLAQGVTEATEPLRFSLVTEPVKTAAAKPVERPEVAAKRAREWATDARDAAWRNVEAEGRRIASAEGLSKEQGINRALEANGRALWHTYNEVKNVESEAERLFNVFTGGRQGSYRQASELEATRPAPTKPIQASESAEDWLAQQAAKHTHGDPEQAIETVASAFAEREGIDYFEAYGKVFNHPELKHRLAVARRG
jgi:hypothetical protein